MSPPSPCLVCQSNSGHRRISPAGPVYEGDGWVVEHAYPSSLLGWLVIVLRRHAEALHELTREEAAELGVLQWAVAEALHAETDCLKEYSVLFAEQPEFAHVHFHVVPRAAALEPELRGGRAFGFLRVSREESVPAEAVRELCDRVHRRLESLLKA